jgi:hypothetical protein
MFSEYYLFQDKLVNELTTISQYNLIKVKILNVFYVLWNQSKQIKLESIDVKPELENDKDQH